MDRERKEKAIKQTNLGKKVHINEQSLFVQKGTKRWSKARLTKSSKLDRQRNTVDQIERDKRAKMKKN